MCYSTSGRELNESVCMIACFYVGLCVCLRDYLFNRTSKLHKILYDCCLWPFLSPVLSALQCVEYFWFLQRHVFR